MVNFGTYLESFRNPAWAEYYVSYEALKRALYTLQDAVKRRDPGLERPAAHADLPEGAEFMRLLEADLAKVNDFYLRKLAALKAIWATLMRKVEHDQGGRHPHRSEAETEALQAEFHALYVEVNLLRDYSSLNYTGFSKILKKHDKTLPHFAMRRRFFEERINCLPVFGILDELYRLQAETQSFFHALGQQHVYASAFAGFNRLDVEISFGEALARATSEIQKSSVFAADEPGQLRKKMADRDMRRHSLAAVDSAADHLLMSEYFQGNQHRQKDKTKSSVLWHRARVTIMAVQAFRKEPVVMPILAALLMIFLGGVGQSFVLEYMVKIDPSSGSTITFFQFLVVALTALHDYLTYTRPDGTTPASLAERVRYLRLKPRHIPIIYHAGCVVLSWLAAILSSVVYSYHISVPFHMVFKSSILLVNMAIGTVILRKRYTLAQVLSVLMVTFGVMMATYASLPNTSGGAGALSVEEFSQWIVGVVLLALSLVFTGFLGILQDLAYRNYGQHWQEALFYAHFLGLPLFVTLGPEIWSHVKFWTLQAPIMWAFLALNTVASFMGVGGMYKLTGLTSSLTGNLTITIRKFLSLIISVVYFKNNFTLVHWLGAALVLVGTALYTLASQRAMAKPAKAKSA